MRRVGVAVPLLVAAAFVFVLSNLAGRATDACADPEGGSICGSPSASPSVSPALISGDASLLPSASPSASAMPSASVDPVQTIAPPTLPPLGAVTFDDEFGGTAPSRFWGQHWQPIGDVSWATSHASVANGVLSIKASRSSGGWVSALVDTSSSFGQRYGVFSARIKVPRGAGLWPSFWLSQPPIGSSPKAEVDVMELCANAPGENGGLDATNLQLFVHSAGGGVPFRQPTRTADLTGAWHVYALDWRADHMAFYLDGAQIARFTNAGAIPNVKLGIILDLATGSWCGETNASTPNPALMQVDWVRVYR